MWQDLVMSIPHVTRSHHVQASCDKVFSDRVTAVEDGETIVKTCSDCWVVGKKSDQREFYVIINQKNANLIEINGK